MNNFSVVRRLLALTTAFALTGCSLSGVIQQSAYDYNAAAATYNDQVLLYTVLRARDEAPINMLALSSINGAASLQMGTTSSVNASNLRGANPVSGVAGSVGPWGQISSSPTWSMASLNTQGFTLGMIQPISPMYAFSKWTSGLDREFLLRLFVKSIKIRDGKGDVEYLNDVGSPTRFAAFNELIHRWTPDTTIRVLTVLEPLGPPFDASPVNATSRTIDIANSTPSRSESVRDSVPNPGAATMLGAYQYLMPLDGGPFHVGNAPPSAKGEPPRLQLFRQFPSQVVLCVQPAELNSSPVTSATLSADARREELYAINQYALAVKAAARQSLGSDNGSVASAQGSAGAPARGQGSTHASLGVNLRANRIAAILPTAACRLDEIVLPPASETRVADLSGAVFSHVEWRSIAEVIQYLGALLRPEVASEGSSWLETSATGAASVRHVAFRLTAGDTAGFSSIDYRGSRYVVGVESDAAGIRVRDHSLQALTLVNELISAIKISGDLPTTPSIQVLP